MAKGLNYIFVTTWSGWVGFFFLSVKTQGLLKHTFRFAYIPLFHNATIGHPLRLNYAYIYVYIFIFV